jgi:hypothetical protein
MKKSTGKPANELKVIAPDASRQLREVLDALELLEAKVCYNRHQVRLERIENGDVKVIDPKGEKSNPGQGISKEIKAQANFAAKEIEQDYGLKNLGPWDDFQWGMINGKLSALRWIIGNKWDDLST